MSLKHPEVVQYDLTEQVKKSAEKMDSKAQSQSSEFAEEISENANAGEGLSLNQMAKRLSNCAILPKQDRLVKNLQSEGGTDQAVPAVETQITVKQSQRGNQGVPAQMHGTCANLQPESECSNTKEVAKPPEGVITKPRKMISPPEFVAKNTVLRILLMLTIAASVKMLFRYLDFGTVLSNDDQRMD